MAFNVFSHVVKTNKKNGSKIAKDSVSWLYFDSNNLAREKHQIKFREYEYKTTQMCTEKCLDYPIRTRV